jgi:Na+(H+)/acetate symporter ActP
MLKPIDLLLIISIVLVSTCVGLVPKLIERLKKRRPNSQPAQTEPHPSFLMNSVSFAISFQTIITSLGVPAEFYHYGFKTYQYSLCVTLAPFIIAFLFVPFLYKLESKSLYDYLDDKFDGSMAVKRFTLAIGLLTQFFYLSLVVLSTGICTLQIVSLIYPFKLWTVIAFVTSLSAFLAILGLSSVIWANFVQFILMTACNVLIIVFSIKNFQSENASSSFTENLYEMYKLADTDNTSRVFVLEENFRYRYTLWNCLIGFTFYILPSYAFTQQSYMRIKSTSSETQAKLLLVSIIPFCFSFLFLAATLGFVAFAYFRKCGDPFEAGLIKNQNEIIVHFLIQFFSDYDGLLGCFVGVLISSSVGIISNILKALSVTLTHDLYDKLLGFNSESNKSPIVEEMIDLNDTNQTRPIQRHLKVTNPKLLEILAVVLSTVVATGFAMVLASISGSMTGMTVSFLSSAYSTLIFVYTSARLNDLMDKKLKLKPTKKLDSLKFEPTHVIISCLVALFSINFIYLGRLLTMDSASEFYFVDRIPKPSNELISKTPELDNFCRYPSENLTQVILKKPSIRPDELTFFNYMFSLSFGWYTCVGFFTCVFVMVILKALKETCLKMRLLENRVDTL